MNQHHMMPHISVESPVTHNSWEDGKYTAYDIVVNCEDDACPLFALSRSTVSRRYREFRWLRKRLCSVSATLVRRIPPLPTVGCILFDDRFSPDFIENRRRGLELFLQGVCAIPTLLSEAALHLFIQTDLNIEEIDAYVNRKWGREEEVHDVVLSLNKQKENEERDEIASVTSLGRWSEASLVDSENTSGPISPGSSTNNTSIESKSTKPATVKKTQPKAVVTQRQVLVADVEVISPVLGLYLPPVENEELSRSAQPVAIRAPRHEDGIASSVPVALEPNRGRRSRSVQIQIPNSASTSGASSLSAASQQARLSSSFSPTSQETEEETIKSPTSVDIYNRRRRGKSPAVAASPNVPYYCSNAVWLSSAVSTGAGRRLRASSPATFVGDHSTPLSPPASAPLVLSGDGRI